MAPNIRCLSYVMAVTQLGSLSETENKLTVSPSAISVAIRDCEDELGFKKFRRKPSQALTGTPLGRRFISETRKFLEQANTYETLTKGLPRQFAARLDVGCFFPLASYLMLDAVTTMIFGGTPVVRLTVLGLRRLPEHIREAAVAYGASN